MTMRIAIISDIHGNAVALDAVLADLRRDRADQTVCLGDAIQGGPQPAEVVARLRDLACPVVMGNADEFLLHGTESSDEGISPERLQKLRVIREWSLTKLSADDCAFIAGFQPTVEIPLAADRSLLCFHGSPKSFDDIILPGMPEADFLALLGPHAPHILTGGHTHTQQLRRLGTADSFFFNPGSVGLSFGHGQTEAKFRADAWADYAMLTVDDGKLALEFRRVPFDVQALFAVYQTSGRPYADEAVAQYQAR
jgi:predicted phosphodiesterase